ncbi:hypothetical protein [uncultured Desulfobacter sp.]|uniref:hypothetical protein n=1 Tax=uncultured Desulfobacter sp. TaxID=240139 RepID=UPI002AA66021|nr:hypothetical protein [uncultured Desulfobacter sp.]
MTRPLTIPVDDLYSFINDFPALLWRIEIRKARIEFLNKNINVAPGIDGALFLKNIAYRNANILPEDQHILEAFMDMVKEGTVAASVFRVKNSNGQISWLKLTGAVNRQDPGYYYGYLLNVDDTVAVIKGILDIDLELKLMIEDINNPVFLFGYDRQELICANPTAKQMFSIQEIDFGKLSLDSFYAGNTRQTVSDILKTLPLSRTWAGNLTFGSADGKKWVQSRTIVRYLVHKEHQIIRISLQNPKISSARNKTVSDSKERHIKELENKIHGLVDIHQIMELCLDSPLAAGLFEGILFSDVHVRKNSVTVYGAGAPFKGMQTSESYSYKGTIAEDINRYSLDYLVVDNTQDSIKPIDWALFVPRGVRSYFAMPFYSRAVLRTVLILCATEQGRFADTPPDMFDDLLKTLNEAVRTWRRSLRS